MSKLLMRSRVQIGTKTYQLRFLRRSGTRDYVGATRNDPRKIVISLGTNDGMFERAFVVDTLVHEFVHAYLFEDVGFTNRAEFFLHEEEFCVQVGRIMSHIAHANPGLLTEIDEYLHG